MSKSKKSKAPTRRKVLKGIGAVAATAAVGCSDDEATNTSGTGGSGGNITGGTGPGGSGTGASSSGGQGTGGEGGAGAGGQGGMGGQGPVCEDNGGLSPEELLAPIDTIVVLCMENRSFDHYLGGSLGLVEGRMDVEGLLGTETNPDPNGNPVSVFQMANLQPEDPPHQWDAVHNQWNGGANDGFVTEHAGASQDEVMGYYVRNQVPIHHALADAYVVCNHMHCSVLGGTWPNRFYLHGGTSNGKKDNTPVLSPFTSIWSLCNDAGVSNINYHHGTPWAAGGYAKLDDLAELFQNFKNDAAAGTLPNFSIIDPQFFGAGANDDHPSNANVPLAQLLIADVYETLAASPQWNSCLLIVTYDEHGGFFDHVPPYMPTNAEPDFEHVGFRVPGLVAGPYVREGCAVNTQFEHCSVLNTVTRRFGVQAATLRSGVANDLSACIDPERVKNANPRPPVMLPQLNVNLNVLKNFNPAPQHAELREVLEQEGLWKHLLKKAPPEDMLKMHLDDAERRGLVRLIR